MPIAAITQTVKEVYMKDQSNADIWSQLMYKVCRKRAEKNYRKLQQYIQYKNILDIGFGRGAMTHLLTENNHTVTGIDVVDLSIYSDLKAILYDGEKIPFKDKSFDVALLIKVLHHCRKQEKVLSEAVRVAKRVIVIEDVHRNWIEWIVVSLNDMMANFEFYYHTYHTLEV